jgi:hypothetical protein
LNYYLEKGLGAQRSASWKINNRSGGGGGRDELKVSLICCCCRARGAAPIHTQNIKVLSLLMKTKTINYS